MDSFCDDRFRSLLTTAARMLCAAAVLVMLSSCIAQKLPVPRSGAGLVAIPYQVRNQSTYGLARAVELRSSTDENFSIRIDAPPFNDDVVLSNPLPAGSYVIDYLVRVEVPVPGTLERGSTGREDLAKSVEFDLKDGEIVLFPMLFRAEQRNKADFVVCRITHGTLSPEMQRSYLEKLETMENGAQWQVRSVH